MADAKTQRTAAVGALALAVGVAFTFAVLYFINYYEPAPPSPNSTTTTSAPTTTRPRDTPGWHWAAEQLASAIDFNADPCENFYQFACGSWKKAHADTQNYSGYVRPFKIQRNKIIGEISDTLKGMNASDMTEPRSVMQAKIFYDACVSHEQDSSAGTKFLKQQMKDFGGWPMVGLPSTSTGMTISSLIGQLSSKYLASTLMAAGSFPAKHPDHFVLILDQASLSLPTIYYTDRFVNASKNALKNMISREVSAVFGNDIVNTTRFRHNVDEIINFEVMLASAKTADADRRNFTRMFNLVNFDQAQQSWPNINWDEYFTALAENNLNASILKQNDFIVTEMEYMNKLNQVILSTDGRIMQNYLMWRLLQGVLPMFFRGNSYGIEDSYIFDESRDTRAFKREDICVYRLLTFLPYAAGRIYVEHTWLKETGDPRQEAWVLSRSVFDAFNVMLEGLSWLDKESKVGAFGKVKNALLNVAFNDWILDNDKLDMAHPVERLNLTMGTDYITAMRSLVSFYSWTDLGNVQKPTRRNAMGNTGPATVDAWYQQSYNSMTLPAGILVRRFFGADMPMAYNYGTIGATIGHELSHSFDDEGIQWDGMGEFRTWMTEESSKGFKEMAQCVVDQYDKFCYNYSTHLCISGVRTQGENIADNGGSRAAYLAFKAHEAMSGEEPRLPGVMSRFSMDQVFHLSVANYFCANWDQRFMERMLLTEAHSPPDARINGRSMNMPQFAEAFQCPIGSYMNPKHRCSVWA